MTISENDIRPQRFNEEKTRTVEADLKFLVDRKKRFVSAHCPACGAKGEHYFDKKGIEYDQCPNCQTVFVNPRPSQELLHEFYYQSQVYAFWNKYIFPASEEARRENIFRPRVKRMIDICRKYGVDTNCILEVGAGFGTFCEEVRSTGTFKEVIAVEPTPDLAETCRRRGLVVHESPIELLDIPEESVDVIAAFETLEHLYSPREFLQSCHRFLRPGGIIVLSCPNFHGFDIMTLRERSNSIDHEHLNYFNPHSLPLLLESCGYQNVDVQTPGELDVDIVRNKVIQGAVSLHESPFLRHILIDRWEDAAPAFQKFLRDNKLSSHMWTVARRNSNAG